MTAARTACAAVVLALLASALASERAWAKAEPLVPRSEMLTVDELRPGMKGIGKSVFRGTKVESFGVTVIGVLRRVDFDGDIILIRIDSGPPVSRGLGVVGGMSGSPIYINGRIIGALSYAWPFSKTPIAGVTPIAQMAEAFQPGSSPIRRQGTLRAARPFLLEGRRIEGAVVAPTASAAPTGGRNDLALVPVSTPVLVSGLSATLIDGLRKALEPLGLVPLAGAGAADHVRTRIVPGQAVGARLVGGDLDVTAIGTVTYVKHGTVLAFGHPMASLGATDLPLVAAYVHGIVPSGYMSFKLASGGQALGRFTEDRPWCVGGRLGGSADLIETGLRVTDRERRSERSYRVEVIRNRALTSALLVAVLAGAIESVGPPSEGTTRARFSVEANGLPRMQRENTYTVGGEVGPLYLLFGGAGGAESATGELSQMLDVLQNSEFGEARLKRLAVEVELSKVRRLARVEDVYIPGRRARAGEQVTLQLTIRTSDGGLVSRAEKVRIPVNCPPGRVRIGVAGGRSAERLRSRLGLSEPRPASLGQMVEQMIERPGNDDLLVALALPTVGVEARGFAFRDLPSAAIDLLRSASADRLRPLRDYLEQRARTEWVISGTAVLTLTVEGDEQDKAGRPPTAGYEPPRYQQIGEGLADLLFGSEFGTSQKAEVGPVGAEGEDVESPPPMPSWEEVEGVGEGEPIELPLAGRAEPAEIKRAEAVGRSASVWRVTDPKEVTKGKAEGVALVSTGAIALAPRPDQMAVIEGRCLWPLAVAPDGSVYTGSWTDGCLRRTAPGGETTVVLETKDAGIQAIAVDAKGTVYAASVPGGTIYRISRGEPPKKLCELGVQNVWALLLGAGDELYAATGTEGELYRIGPDGSTKLAFTAADRHITCLAAGGDGTIYLGTSPLGKVYAVPVEGSPRSLCEVDKAAVQSIAVDAVGNVYVGTSPDAKVLKIEQSGAARELFKAKGRHTLALLCGSDGTLYAAVGPEARIVAISPDGGSAVLYDPRATFIAALAFGPEGDIYLTVTDAGRLVKLDRSTVRTGRYLSPVHDAGAAARWGAIRWRGRVPPGTGAAVLTRSGATGYPDETWSEWAPVTLGAGSAVASPPARFLQCRLDLTTSSTAPPEVEALEVSYLPANRSPEVKLISPRGGEIWSGKQTIRWAAQDADEDRLKCEVWWSSDGGATWTRIEQPEEGEKKAQASEAKPDMSPPPAGKRKGQGASAIKPPAAATGRVLPSTSLRARLHPPAAAVDDDLGEAGLEGLMLPAGETGQEGEDLEGEPQQPEPAGEEAVRPTGAVSPATSLRWTTTSVADGEYLLKVIATDARANPDDPQQAEAVSRPLIVDNTPPELVVDLSRRETDPPPPSVGAYERASYIVSAEFSVDDGEWLAAMPGDGVFDGQYDTILLDVARLPEGSHQVEVRVRDAAGNAASTTLRYQR